jgi:serine/threonine-protein kinase
MSNLGEPSRWTGRVLRDKWRIDGRIARGGVGTVYAATHRKNGSRVAIKVLHPQFSRDEDTRSRFLQEGYAANRVGHPGVVRILDDDVTEEGFAFLVMELLEGELLERRRVRKGGMLPLREVYEVADQLLDVLAAAHDKSIVHRDIKPDNLFVTNEGRLKVLDFGFAHMKSGFRKEQTATGYLLGTPGFMSPEQATGNRDEIDAQTDIWAAGATLFTLISGHPVHDGESAAAMLMAAANYQPRSLATVTTGLSPELVRVVDRAVAFNKAARWPNARAMQAALRNVPGRPVGRMFESGRRSIPDNVLPPANPAEIEFLAADEVEEVPASSGPQTAQTASTKPPARTTAHPAPSALRAAPRALSPRPPAMAHDRPIVPSVPSVPTPSSGRSLPPIAFGSQQPVTPLPLAAPLVAPLEPRLSIEPTEPTRAGELDVRPSRARSVLLFVFVMVLSMAIVIVVGLAILGLH